jgi:glycosyltransferase involved in cell wall biosynthesis
VLETLESAKSQTYQNVELIISDDASQDKTVEICENWLSQNRERFVRTELISSEKNTGISANCNRGVNSSKGEWIKLIAGDDILLERCISLNIDQISLNKYIKVIFSNCELFILEENKIKPLHTQPLEEQKIWFKYDAKNQYLLLLKFNFIWTTPTMFIQNSFLKEIKQFDERFPFLEDYPLWLKITQKGYQLHYFDENTILYRQSESITRVKNEWMNYNHFKSRHLFFKLEIGPKLKNYNMCLYFSKFLFTLKIKTLIFVFKNKKTFLARVFNKLYQYVFNPISI